MGAMQMANAQHSLVSIHRGAPIQAPNDGFRVHGLGLGFECLRSTFAPPHEFLITLVSFRILRIILAAIQRWVSKVCCAGSHKLDGNHPLKTKPSIQD